MNNKELKRILSNAKTIIVSTDDGIYVEGNVSDVASVFSNLVNKMQSGGFSTELLKLAFNLGLKDIEELKEQCDNLDKITKRTKKAEDKISKNLIDELESIFGDGDDE